MKIADNSVEPEFSFPLVVEKIPAGGLEQSLDAGQDERERLAGRFGLLELPSLRAELTVHPMRGDRMVPVTGRVVAEVVQACVVTLEPLANHIEYDIDVLYAAPETAGEEGAGSPSPDDREIEPIVDGIIDLGELVAQHFGVALDPYPRKPGVAFVEAEYGGEKSGGPFAQLANWPKKPKN